MQLHDLKTFPAERHARKRVGRGQGSGLGGTSGRGHKGQNARSGGGVRPGFEGGQMPLQRRLPKHGFKNALFKVTYSVINLASLQEAFPEQLKISLDDIYNRGLARRRDLVKILSDGEVLSPIIVEAHRFSEKAEDKIVKAGGKVCQVGLEIIESEEPVKLDEN